VRTMIISWPDVGFDVTVDLESEKNPNLIDEIWNNLPMAGVQEHSMVTGKSMYTWVPMVSVAPVEYTMRIHETPPGTVSFSQKTGNKMIVRYGRTTEDLDTPIVGFVRREDLGKINEIGERAWQSTYRTKEILRVEFKRGEE
jgi:hypothetical protein